jgi:paraquat-inducible protein B
MSAKANYFKLGLFIIVAVLLGVAAVLLFGAGRVFEKRMIIETYFNQSVQGIDVGSKVKFRGVPLGNVRKIDFTLNHYQLDKPRAARRSYVRLEIELKADAFGNESENTIKKGIGGEVARGLRVRVTSQGVTGTSYIEIDYLDPARYPPLAIDWEPQHPYIPSAPSAFSRIVSSAEDFFTELEKVNIAKIATDVEDLITSATEKVNELPLGMLGTNANSLVAELRDSNQRIQKLLDGPELKAILGDGSGAISSLRRTAESPGLTNSIAQLDRTLRRLDRVVIGKDNDLQLILENLRALTENLVQLSENAKLFPAQVLFGEPPKPSKNLP